MCVVLALNLFDINERKTILRGKFGLSLGRFTLDATEGKKLSKTC